MSFEKTSLGLMICLNSTCKLVYCRCPLVHESLVFPYNHNCKEKDGDEFTIKPVL